MSNIFAMYTVATRAMQTQSYMISTASHNISNAETPGYSRQRVDLAAATAYSYVGVGQIGTGVEIQAVKRLRDNFLDVQVRYETSIMSKYAKAQESLDQIETIFKEPSLTGLSSVMNSMWNSWSELAGKPEGTTQRSIVAQRADDMAKTMNHMYEQLETLNKNTVSEIEGDVYEANAILGQIQDVCSQIYDIKLTGMEPNDLLDKRDLLLERLAGIVNIDVQEDKFGRVRITETDSGNDYELLNYSKDTPPEFYMSVVRSAEYNPSSTPPSWTLTVVNGGDISDVQTVVTAGPVNDENWLKPGDVIMSYTGSQPTQNSFEGPFRPTYGSIAGAQMSIEKAEGYMSDLDDLAYTIASAINTVHGMTGASNNIPFFTVKDTTAPGFPDFAANATTKGAAKNIKVSDEIMADESLIKAGLNTSVVGDVRRAKAISQLQDTTFDMFSINDVNKQFQDIALGGGFDPVDLTITSSNRGTTTNGFYTNLVGKIGIDSESSQRNIENQETLVLQLKSKQASTAGVSIDEEVANLMQFQTAYQANARVMNTITTILDTLINLGR